MSHITMLTFTILKRFLSSFLEGIIKLVHYLVNEAVKIFKAKPWSDDGAAHWTMIFPLGPTSDTMFAEGVAAVEDYTLK